MLLNQRAVALYCRNTYPYLGISASEFHSFSLEPDLCCFLFRLHPRFNNRFLEVTTMLLLYC